MLEINVTNFITIAAMTLVVLVVGGGVERYMRGKNDNATNA